MPTCVVELELVDLQLADWQWILFTRHYQIPEDVLQVRVRPCREVDSEYMQRQSKCKTRINGT
jgi:hypothetical protein